MSTFIEDFSDNFKPKSVEKACKNCRHYCAYVYEFDASAPEDMLVSDYGECRRFPPKSVPPEETGFPVVEESSWCGEFDI